MVYRSLSRLDCKEGITEKLKNDESMVMRHEIIFTDDVLNCSRGDLMIPERERTDYVKGVPSMVRKILCLDYYEFSSCY